MPMGWPQKGSRSAEGAENSLDGDFPMLGAGIGGKPMAGGVRRGKIPGRNPGTRDFAVASKKKAFNLSSPL